MVCGTRVVPRLSCKSRVTSLKHTSTYIVQIFRRASISSAAIPRYLLLRPRCPFPLFLLVAKHFFPNASVILWRQITPVVHLPVASFKVSSLSTWAMGLLIPPHTGYETRSPPYMQAVPRNPPSSSSSGPWFIAVIVVGCLIMVGLIALIVFYLIRSRRQRREIRRADVVNGQTPWARRFDKDRRTIAEEVEREEIIRKSLASRNSTVWSKRASQLSGISDFSLGQISDESDAVTLKDDYKSWEARIVNERAGPSRHDSDWSDHPAFSTHLRAPEASRVPATAPGVVQSRRESPPPQLAVAVPPAAMIWQ
ncbi:hypothetical protein F4780DRAFT_361918 [Xylariomycetidae sp. FL0641]|nr:hypothetical protein F4780DRAFT_361918 [Xylariomycetidae sp. FL0641]